MKKLIQTILLTLIISNVSFSQKKIDFFIEGGVCNRTFVNEFCYSYRTYYQPSFRTGFDLYKNTKHNFVIGSKLSLSAFSTKTDRIIYGGHQYKDELEKFTINDQFLILGLNPYIGLKIKIISINLGFLIMDNLLFKTRLNGTVYGENHNNTSEIYYKGFFSTGNLSTGLSMSITYKMNDKITLETTCLKSSNHVTQYYGEDLNLKLHQLNFGFKYNLLDFKKKETKEVEVMKSL